MDSAENWKEMFTAWPEGIPHRGVIMTTLNEAVPFKGFKTKGDTLLLERTNPDAIGARFVLIGFEMINSLKFIDPLKERLFDEAGFVGKFSDA